ncbi:polyprenyl synthetase family protein [Martelella lutilitoris]|uniref:Probable farnesyl diphosphate synthase n=1 Tax=Martelella lutilitoris TaxID=2583532 RepID=A0A7T7HJJ3_9HYPH|nr:farnesyl diphosphate synthase [Martelella lutilitoris]QQM30361.1 polyprenyl synthetase family protein [Martelella lutilitoris]
MTAHLFTDRLEDARTRVEACLEGLLGSDPLEGETARPPTLVAAIRHGVLNGGKRFRPFLVIESTRLFDGPEQAALRVGAALECIHCYSLIHDDLPAMDDDDLRRGRPTVHKAYDEASAILAGDSLLTLAFDIIADDETALSPEARLRLIAALSRAAGIGGMAGGQALDLAAEKSPPDEDGIITLQAMKTGALIRFGAEAGALIAGAGEDERRRLHRYGAVIGLAFQLADDLLDLTADAETMGKATGKDAGRGKGTLVALHGPEWAERRLGELVAEAESLLSPFGAKAETLVEAAHFVARRKN